MARPAPYLLIAALVTLVPAAHAAEISVKLERGDDHPPDHPIELSPASRKTVIPLKITVDAKEFVCTAAGGARLNVEIKMAAYKDVWAGASPNPSNASISIPLGEPALGKNYTADGVAKFEIYWDEDHPRTGAREEYQLDTDAKPPDGCVPAPTVKQGSLALVAQMPDMAPNETASPAACQEDPARPGCASAPASGEPGGSSPGFGAALAVAAACGLAVASRRRR